MRKILAILAVLIVSVCGLFVFSGCNEEENFVADSYSCNSNMVTDIQIDVADRKIDIGESKDDKIHVDFFESEKEYYDIANVDGTLTIRLILEKEWTDFIGTKPDAQYRQITVRIPENILGNLSVKTTNEDVNIEPITISDNLILDVNGGNISFDMLSAGSNIDLTVKNGNIKGSIIGGWDDFAISCQIKKGESNLPENKEGGDKRLSVNCNNGNVDIEFKPQKATQ